MGMTWEQICEHEPALFWLEEIASRATYPDPDNAYRYALKPMIESMVGFYSQNTPLMNTEAYDLVVSRFIGLLENRSRFKKDNKNNKRSIKI